MRRLFTGLTCAALPPGVGPVPLVALALRAALPFAAAVSLGAALSVGVVAPSAGAAAASIPRPFPGGPAAHSAAWHPVRGISRALLLTIARGESATPSDRVVLLQCASPGGTHPRATEACRLLEPVKGDLGDLKMSSDAACAKRYEPMTVSASGIWDGRRLYFERTFGNTCELSAYTGAVFNF
ncbi:SSI family serine proteinase inhibitor [Sphaerisporangium sp. NPDC088356]|uniref:SSI family serine proteinase inhibitor n=1 Tax=Sphaerisporangium sp. NPDC088356 TaxID=3154871 RepID=UPI00341B037F